MTGNIEIRTYQLLSGSDKAFQGSGASLDDDDLSALVPADSLRGQARENTIGG